MAGIESRGWLSLLLCTGLLLPGGARAREDAGSGPRVGVIDFANGARAKWGGRGGVERGAAEAMARALARSGRLVVVGPAEVQRALGRHAAAGAASPQAAMQLGRRLKLRAIVSGSVTAFGVQSGRDGSDDEGAFRARLSVRVIDPRSGRALLSETGEGIARLSDLGTGASHLDEALGRRALDDAVAPLVEKIVRAAAVREESASAPAAASTPIAVKAPAKPGPPIRAGGLPNKGHCPDGQYMTAATAGHCCWSGQVWADKTRACIGIPRCPTGFVARGTACAKGALADHQYDDGYDDR